FRWRDRVLEIGRRDVFDVLRPSDAVVDIGHKVRQKRVAEGVRKIDVPPRVAAEVEIGIRDVHLSLAIEVASLESRDGLPRCSDKGIRVGGEPWNRARRKPPCPLTKVSTGLTAERDIDLNLARVLLNLARVLPRIGEIGFAVAVEVTFQEGSVVLPA